MKSLSFNRNMEGLPQDRQKLKVTPDDPDANTKLGAFYCFRRGNWSKGIPFLRKGPPLPFGDLAKRDPQTEKDILKVADDWWAVAETQPEPQKHNIQVYAARSFYSRVVKSLAGIEKVKAEKRLASVGEMVVDAGPKGQLDAAERGDAAAQVALGVAYLSGSGAAKDEKEAFKWFSKAAQQNRTDAIRWLAYMYSSGIGATKNIVEARAQYRRAADLGDLEAQFDLANMLMTPESGRPDGPEAAKLLRKACDKGHIGSLKMLASMLSAGQYLPEDKSEAFRLYKQAADAGDAEAKYTVSECYMKGTGVAQDEKAAITYLMASVKDGNVNAKCTLAAFMAMGNHVPKDEKSALKLFQEAVDSSPKDAQVLNALSWFLLNTTDIGLRNNVKALNLASSAVDLTPNDPNLIDTLALALFENGEFGAAVKRQEQALELLPQDSPQRPSFFARYTRYAEASKQK